MSDNFAFVILMCILIFVAVFVPTYDRQKNENKKTNTNNLYVSKKGTKHIVKKVEVIREFYGNEPISNTAPLYQVVMQRQKFDNKLDSFVDDKLYPLFCMQESYFEDMYRELEQNYRQTSDDAKSS